MTAAIRRTMRSKIFSGMVFSIGAVGEAERFVSGLEFGLGDVVVFAVGLFVGVGFEVAVWPSEGG